MNSSIYSNRILRKLITSFGSVFSNLTLVRYNTTTGAEQQRLVVPISFAEKEKYIQAIQGDPTNTKPIQINLPVLSFDFRGISYDPTRKLQTTLQNFSSPSPGNYTSQYIPSPWNLSFELYLYVRNVEDGTQIIEQILPYFIQDYTLRVNLMPTMGITKDVPIILDDVNYEVFNEGDTNSETRILIWTLGFTMKGWLFGPTVTSGLIQEAIMNIYDTNVINGKDIVLVLEAGGTGTYKQGELVYQGQNTLTANASAIVTQWSPLTNRMTINKQQGLFVTNGLLVGSESDAHYLIQNYEILPNTIETIVVTPNPPNANVANNTGFITTITPTV